jgi:hypothetical protein
MKAETIAKAVIEMARRYPGIGKETIVKLADPGSFAVRSARLDRKKISDPVFAQEPINEEQINLEVFTDGNDDFILIGYGQSTDALVLAEFDHPYPNVR